MIIINRLLHSLGAEVGWSSTSPHTIHVSDSNDLSLDLDVTNVERKSCSFRELRLHTGHLNHCPSDELRRVSEEICRRVTYLFERLALIEFDPQVGAALIRSEKPDRRPDVSRYYEVQLDHTGSLALRRFEFAPQTSRIAIDLQATNELLEKLVPDLVEATTAAR